MYVGVYAHVWVQRPAENIKCALLYAGVTGMLPHLVFDMGTGIYSMSHPPTPKLSLQPLFLGPGYSFVFFLVSPFSFHFFSHAWSVHEAIILQMLTYTLLSSDQ